MTRASILLIEPDLVLGRTVARALNASGWDTRHVLTAQSAIVEADKLKPGLVICELQLVSHSGFEFLYEFRSYSDWQLTPVVIFTSVPLIEFAGSQEGLNETLGINKYLYKPNTNLRQLIRTVEQILPTKVHEAV